MIKTSDHTCERGLIEHWVNCWGCAASEAVLEPTFSYFRAPNIDGCIGYRIESNCAVAIGDPICNLDEIPKLALAFHKHCQHQNLNVIYIIASERFAKWAIQDHCTVLIECGEELILDPQIDYKFGPKASKLRNKISHAIKDGISAHEYLLADLKLEQSIKQAANKWRQARQGPQIYLGPLNFFGNRSYKRWFYAANGEDIVGAALLSRLEAQKGYLLKHLIVVPKAPRGTSELLLTFILETLQKENCNFVTHGIISASHLGEMIGLGKITTCLAKGTFNVVKWIFKLEKQKQYWQQFQPMTQPVYLLFGNSRARLQNLRAVMKVLNIEF